MILAREPFGKLPYIPENSLVGPMWRYYLTPDFVRRRRGPRSQEAFRCRRRVKRVFVLHRESQDCGAVAQSGYDKFRAALFCVQI